LQRGPAQFTRRSRDGGHAVLKRGEIGRALQTRRSGERSLRNVVRGSDNPNITRRKQGDQTIANRSAPALTGNRNAAIERSVLRNRAIADRSVRDRSLQKLAHANFRGKFAERSGRLGYPRWAAFHRDRFHRHRFHRPIFVIGWIGPLFWPYAYDDFIDYTFWPYAYDTFWPYAYDDVYVSIFGPYAYSACVAYPNPPAYPPAPPAAHPAP